MKVYAGGNELNLDLKKVVAYSNGIIRILDKQRLRNNFIDNLVYTAVFAPEEKLKKFSRDLIRKISSSLNIFPASINSLYREIGRSKISDFTVPAINIRGLTYDTAKIIFELIIKNNIGPLIFEIARSEIGYTEQRPDEYMIAILAAAIKTGYSGPIFIQGDHYQIKASVYKESPNEELNKIKNLIKESIEAGFYNIDIDASTLVDLNKPGPDEQQQENYKVTHALTKYVRSIQPKNTVVSIGGEIGHIGGKNSTPEEFIAFMDGYLSLIKQDRIESISKISVQTGTSHGGIPLLDGTIADVTLDFGVLKEISKIGRKKYQIGGAVQHGASTLPNELFNKFPEIGTLEIHLATGFQNIIYDNLPKKLKNEIYQWLINNLQKEKKPGMTEKQFIYKTRKKAFGPFKYKLWMMSKKEKEPIITNLRKQFRFLFNKLNIFNTGKFVKKLCTKKSLP